MGHLWVAYYFRFSSKISNQNCGKLYLIGNKITTLEPEALINILSVALILDISTITIILNHTILTSPLDISTLLNCVWQLPQVGGC